MPACAALEVQFDRELEHAWIIRLRDLAEGRGVDVLVQRRGSDKKIGFVQDVERLHPELQVDRLVNLRPLDEPEVHVPNTGAAHGRQLKVADRAGLRIRKEGVVISQLCSVTGNRCHHSRVEHQWTARRRVEEQPSDCLKLINRQRCAGRVASRASRAVQRPASRDEGYRAARLGDKDACQFHPTENLAQGTAVEPTLTGAEREFVTGVGLEYVGQVVVSAAFLDDVTERKVEEVDHCQSGHISKITPQYRSESCEPS